MRSLILLSLAACVSLPRLPPKLRDSASAAASSVRLDVQCNQLDPFARTQAQGAVGPASFIEWMPPRSGTGTLITERHIITSAHVVACPVIPSVHVTLPTGERIPVVVEKEDRDHDIARLEIWSADNFGLGIVPPVIAPAVGPGMWCARPVGRAPACGTTFYWEKDTAWFNAKTRPGDSGSGVYDASGRLVGIVAAGLSDATKIVNVGAEWMP